MAAFEFGPFLLDPAKRSLLREGVPQSLPPKAFDVRLFWSSVASG
jgi:DNA-binding winged helix-turn-helix (wHTH) protein